MWKLPVLLMTIGMICTSSRILPLYVVFSTRRPCEFLMYPMALVMSSLWCFGLLWFGNLFSGIMVGCFIVSLSFVDLLVWLIRFVVCDPLVV